MRTTVTLDDDVMLTVRDEMKVGSGKNFKVALNDLIRRARYVPTNGNEPREPFKLKGRLLRSKENINFDCISKLLEDIERPDFK